MSFFNVNENIRRDFGTAKLRLVPIKDSPHDSVSRSFVENRVPARLVNDNETATNQVIVDIFCIINRCAVRVLFFNPPDEPRAVRVSEHLQNFLQVVVRPRA